MEYHVEVSARAQREAEAIFDRIAADAPRTAERWYRKLFQKIDSLRTLPERFSIADESRLLGQELRELLYGKRHSVYRIIYVVRGKDVEVVSIRHARSGPFSP